MGFYRRIDTRMHGDKKFLSLSRPQPNAQTLFEWLIHGPYSNSIGLYEAGPAGMAERLKWPLKAFLERFGELLPDHGCGIVDYCPTHSLVFVINFLKYNPPSNRNILIGWQKVYDSLPQCRLRLSWVDRAKQIGDSFGKWFDISLLDPFANHDWVPECHISPTPAPTPPPAPTPNPTAETERVAIQARSAEEGQQVLGVLNWLNEKASRNFPPTQANLGLIRGRLREGFKPEQLKSVVSRKVRTWKGTEREEYLRPATLFGPEKFSSYVGELPAP